MQPLAPPGFLNVFDRLLRPLATVSSLAITCSLRLRFAVERHTILGRDAVIAGTALRQMVDMAVAVTEDAAETGR